MFYVAKPATETISWLSVLYSVNKRGTHRVDTFVR